MESHLAHGFLQRKHVVVVGAGYVGGAVARCALAAGARVTALTRNPERAAELGAQGATVIVDRLETESWHGQILGEVHFVLNAVSSGGGGLDGYRRSYVEGMHSLRRWACARTTAGHLIYTSSTSVYPQDGGASVDETMAVDPSAPRPAILLEAESGAQAWPGRWTVLRLAGIYGPGRHHLLDALRAGEPTVAGHGGHHLNLIHRDDIVSAVLAAWARGETAAGRIFNVVDDGRATKAVVIAWLANALSRAQPEFSGVPQPGRRAQAPDRIITNHRIKAGLDWSPRYPTFREGYAALLGA